MFSGKDLGRTSSLEQPPVMRPVGPHQPRVQRENEAHDQQVAWHHEHAPHEHAEGVWEGHQDTELFPARQHNANPGDELDRADEGEKELGFQHGEHKGRGFWLGIACGHDCGVGHVYVVEVLEPRCQQEEGVEVFQDGVKSRIHVVKFDQFQAFPTLSPSRSNQGPVVGRCCIDC